MSMLGTALGMGRRMAESRMTDSCKATRPGAKTWDETAGEWTETLVEVYSGPCRIRHSSAAGRDVDAGSQLLTVGSLEVHVPVGSAVFRPDDRIAVTGCPTRPDQVGRVFIVIAPFDGSGTTAVRYRVEAFDPR
jgi:hypothetical protein